MVTAKCACGSWRSDHMPVMTNIAQWHRHCDCLCPGPCPYLCHFHSRCQCPCGPQFSQFPKLLLEGTLFFQMLALHWHGGFCDGEGGRHFLQRECPARRSDFMRAFVRIREFACAVALSQTPTIAPRRRTTAPRARVLRRRCRGPASV